ncbi:hypothetical protein M2322_003192 [Rhodoblastus acidophilus]|uniref:hypothetical protein n=1 Tax=Rhodoblastus acidophilus TaxID=1074 RepID=UPI002223EFA5|nr:hypothetical protein [Rhodoblastus acidophilus]MCW2317628.1 hypothetical protein [Rhodoblastus acidophilus]
MELDRWKMIKTVAGAVLAGCVVAGTLLGWHLFAGSIEEAKAAVQTAWLPALVAPFAAMILWGGPER